MNNILCSIVVSKNILAVLILEDGMIKRHMTERVRDQKARETPHAGSIYGMTVALRYVRDYIQQSDGESYSVCFELSNSTLIKWVENQYSKEYYQDEFLAMLRLLNELPIMYMFHYSTKPKAFVYAAEKYCKRDKLSGLDLEG